MELGAALRTVGPGKVPLGHSDGGRARRFSNNQFKRLITGGTNLDVTQYIGAASWTLAHKEHVAPRADLSVDQQLEVTVGAIKDQGMVAGSTDVVILDGSCSAVGAVGLTAGRTETIHQQHYSLATGAQSAAGRHLGGLLPNGRRNT